MRIWFGIQQNWHCWGCSKRSSRWENVQEKPGTSPPNPTQRQQNNTHLKRALHAIHEHRAALESVFSLQSERWWSLPQPLFVRVSELVWDIHGYPPIAILIRKIVIIIHWELAISYFQTNPCGSVSPRWAEKTTCDSIARGGCPQKINPKSMCFYDLILSYLLLYLTLSTCLYICIYIHIYTYIIHIYIYVLYCIICRHTVYQYQPYLGKLSYFTWKV